MRIVFDVSPLSHERTGVSNYIRGSLAGLAEAARATGDEVVAFAPTSPAGRARDPARRSTGSRVELRLRRAAGRARAGARPGRGSAGRRPSAGSARFDVLHFTDWMYPPQRAGLRATTIHDLVPLHFPEWVHAAHARDARRASTRTRRAPAT